ncbi:MAG: RtcB family protein [Patescibacteria group bacterium]|jgi:tRNA-splicing ligase RtcB
MYKINEKILTWLDPSTIEPEALAQLHNISEMPFVFKHLAVMPDCHLGKGATVGSVIATQGAIIPAAVGVDIGCGMIAVRTKFFSKDLPDDLEKLRHSIERRIPLGAGVGNRTVEGSALERVKKLKEYPEADLLTHLDKHWEGALGSLGSGNHFIEISLDENEQVWVVLHSGSRGIGNKIACKHIKVAQDLCEQMFVALKDKDLAYLPAETDAFKAYIRDLHWAQDFALANREEMMDRVMKDLSYAFYKEDSHQKEIEIERINCHHNFTQQENHYGKNVWITRKGAIQMRRGQFGIIPGSMGTRSYIVSGKQNDLSFHSAPHGAGRRFSRSEARRRFTMADFESQMAGVVCRHSSELIDELPGAYKDIDDVMENAKELVEIKHVLKQVLSIKGD